MTRQAALAKGLRMTDDVTDLMRGVISREDRELFLRAWAADPTADPPEFSDGDILLAIGMGMF